MYKRLDLIFKPQEPYILKHELDGMYSFKLDQWPPCSTAVLRLVSETPVLYTYFFNKGYFINDRGFELVIFRFSNDELYQLDHADPYVPDNNIHTQL